jgi:hypothetical protein
MPSFLFRKATDITEIGIISKELFANIEFAIE